ncbi:MAG: Fic family protein [Candidatus Limnocylindria bacterium]
MQSFLDVERTLAGQPARLGGKLARLDVGRGREGMFRDQLPELLRALAEETRIASITASNAIEGVTVAAERAEVLAAPGAERPFRNRSEREFAGYRDAIDEITRAEGSEPISLAYMLHLHRLLFRYTEEPGGALKIESNQIASYERGHREIVFEPPPPSRTEGLLRGLVDAYTAADKDQLGHPVIVIGAFILDFLAIHPVADGNGRLARLLTSHLLLQHGYGVVRFVSIEQRILDTKGGYYAALRESQVGWHEGEHTIWPWITYLIEILSEASDDFEARIASRRSLEGMSKQARVREYLLNHAAPLVRMREIRRALPGVSDQTIRLVLAQMRDEGLIELDREIGKRGRQATWRRIG